MSKPEKSLRITLVIPHLGGGGAERSVLKLAQGLIQRRHRVDILLFEKIETLEDEIPPRRAAFCWNGNGYMVFETARISRDASV